MGLPLSTRGGRAYDTILVIIDRYSKIVRLLSYRNTINTLDLVRIIIDDIISKYGALRSIISDRGTTFTSTY